MPSFEQEAANEIAMLCELYGVTALSERAMRHVRLAVARRRRSRDASRHDLAVAELDEAQSANADPDYNHPPGDRAADFEPDTSEETRLPESVSVGETVERYRRLHYDEPASPWQPKVANESDPQALKRLSAANKVHYGETGEGTHPNDYVSNRGVDPKAETRSPPPRGNSNWTAESNMGGFDADGPQPMRSGPVQRTYQERDFPSQRVNRQPYVGSGYPSGPSPIPTATGEQDEKNFGTAEPSGRFGNPDQWTRQRGARPDRFDPKGVGVGSGDAATLRAWNNQNRARHGDAPIRTTLPRPQMPERAAEAVDWRGRRTLNGVSL